MDTKDLIKSLQKHSFWITTGAVVVMFLLGWYMSTKKLQGEAAMFLGEIETGFSSVSSVINDNPNHPNDHSHEKMNVLVEQLKQNLLDAWELQYERQKDVLVWPQGLGEDFLADINRLLEKNGQRYPIETVNFPSEAPEDNLQRHLLEQYQLYVLEQVPPLAEVIRSDWEAGKPKEETGGDSLPGFGGTGQPASDRSKALGPPPIVSWDSASQSSTLGRFQWARTPTTMQVLYAQEDLWVLNQIMQVVKNVNQDALVPSKAVITEILNIEVGRNADGIKDVGSVTSFSAAQSGSSGGGMGDEMGGEGMDDMMGMAAGMDDDEGGSEGGGSIDSGSTGTGTDTGTGTTSTASAHPAHHRYVDNTFSRLEADRLKTALEPSTSPDLETIYLAVAKRYPIRLRLKMDLTKLPELLTACGNAKLPIEILQVSVNGSAGRGGSSGGGAGMDEGGGMEGGSLEEEMFGGTMDDGEEGGEGMDMFGGGGPASSTTERLLLTNFPYEEEIELYGVVYIYNPINIEMLRIAPEEPAANNAEAPAEANPPAQ